MSKIYVDILKHSKLLCIISNIGLEFGFSGNYDLPEAGGYINSINVLDQIETEAQHVCCWVDGNFLLSIFTTYNYMYILLLPPAYVSM